MTAADWTTDVRGTGGYADVNGINLYYNLVVSLLFATVTLSFLDAPGA